MIGEKVYHKIYGIGTVTGELHKGLELLIRFHNGSERQIRSDYVTLVSPTRTVPVSSSQTKFDTGQFYARMMIEAFRLGVVPYGKVDQFTFGRDTEIDTVKKWLCQDDSGPLIIEGTYGTGKSHFIDYIFAWALNNGYAVVKTDLDPHTCPPHRPKQVYSQLTKSFRFKKANKTSNLRDFLRAATNIGDKNEDLIYLNDVLFALKHYPENPIIWDWIEGQSSGPSWIGDGYHNCILPSLNNVGTASNIYCHILSELAWIATNHLNLKGFLILLDEGESATYSGYARTQTNQGWSFIQGLMALSANDIRLKNEPINRSYGEAGGRYFGEQTGLIYSGHDTYVRYCLNSLSDIKVVFSFTEVQGLSNWLKDKKIPNTSIQMNPLSEEVQRVIFNQICLLYQSAFQSKQITDSEAYLEKIHEKCNDGIRQFIKGSVEVLDIKRSNPTINVEQIE